MFENLKARVFGDKPVRNPDESVGKKFWNNLFDSGKTAILRKSTQRVVHSFTDLITRGKVKDQQIFYTITTIVGAISSYMATMGEDALFVRAEIAAEKNGTDPGDELSDWVYVLALLRKGLAEQAADDGVEVASMAPDLILNRVIGEERTNQLMDLVRKTRELDKANNYVGTINNPEHLSRRQKNKQRQAANNNK